MLGRGRDKTPFILRRARCFAAVYLLPPDASHVYLKWECEIDYGSVLAYATENDDLKWSSWRLDTKHGRIFIAAHEVVF